MYLHIQTHLHTHLLTHLHTHLHTVAFQLSLCAQHDYVVLEPWSLFAGAEALQALPASPTHTDQQVTDADANEPKPAKRMGAKERKKIAAAVKAQQGSTDAEAAVAPSPAPVKDKLADKQRQAATAAESSSTIAAHRPPPAVAVKGKAQLPTEPAAADDKGKRPMQPKAAAQPDAKRAKLQAPPAAPAATSDEPSTTTAADAEPQSVASPSHDAQLAAPDAAAGEDWIVAGGGKKRRGAAGREADAASPTGDSRAEPSDAAAGSDGSPVAQLETQPKLSRKAARRKAQDERKLKAQSQASSDASPTPINVGPAAAAPVVAAPEADQAAPLSAIHEEETAVDKVSLEVVASIFKAKLPVIPPTRTGVQRTQRRSSGDWQPEAREVLLNKPKPKSGLPRGFKPIEDMPSDIAAQGLAQQPKQNPVLKKLLPGKPQPRKKRAIAEAKSANADSADGKQS